MHAKVRTKEYPVADTEYVRGAVERTMVQHLAFGLLLYEFLPELHADE
jgi:PadR family transcriptional regulator, activator of gas vesicle formation